MAKTIKELLGLPNNYKDVYGVEFEIEYKRGVEFKRAPEGWSVDPDEHSIRNGLEYVMDRPEDLISVRRTIDKFSEVVPTDIVNDNGYAGTHVHCNVSDLTKNQLFNFILTYLSMENVLSKRFFGEDREGSLFCLRLSDADYLEKILRRVVVEDNLRLLEQENIRYCSLNVLSLFKYGTLEFRGLRGDGDYERVKDWIVVIHALKEFSRKVEDPIALLTLSSKTAGEFAKEILPDLSKEEQQEVYRGVRRVQGIAFEGSWE